MKGKQVGEGAAFKLLYSCISLCLLAVSLFCSPRDASVRQSPLDFYLPVTTSILQNGETEGRFSELFHVTKSPVTATECSSYPQLQSLNQLSCHRVNSTKKAEYNHPS